MAHRLRVTRELSQTFGRVSRRSLSPHGPGGHGRHLVDTERGVRSDRRANPMIADPGPGPLGGTIEIDVAALTFIDSSGLRVLCTAASRLGPQGHLIVSQPTRAVRRTIELTGLERIVEIVDIRQRGSRKRGVRAHGTDDEEPPR